MRVGCCSSKLMRSFTIAAATAVSETPSHPQFMHDALDLEAAWVMEAIDRLDEYLSSGGRPRAGSPRPMP